MKILHRIGTSALAFSLSLTGLFIFTAWKAVDESLIFSDDPLKDQQVWQSNSTIPVGHEDTETEACPQSKKINSSNDSDGAGFLEDDQPVLGLQFFARTLSLSSTALLQYSGIHPCILDMRTIPMSQADQDYQKVNENPMLFGDHRNNEDDRRGEISIGELQQGDVTPPAWLSGSYADRTSNSMEVDITNGVIEHANGNVSSRTLLHDKHAYPGQQKYGSGLDTIPPPKQTDILIIDLGQADKADPGDRIRYEVTIENNGSNDEEGIQLQIVPDPLTTFIPGSFRSSPLAVNDSYTSTGNVGINISAVNGLKANDFDDDISGATITAGTFTTTGGGSIMINADGSFLYTPAVGFTGSDTYTYTLNDGNSVGGSVPADDMATVTIAVSNLIWFIDNSSVAGSEDGRLNTPFKTIANFTASSLPQAGEVIFIRQTGTIYSGGFLLKNSQYLFGSGHSGGTNLADSGVLPFTVATNSFMLPDIGGARTLFRNSSGTGITLASGNTIRGVEVGRCSGVKISGTAFGTLTIGNTTNPDVSLSGNQQALSLTNGTFASTSKFVSISCLDSSRVVLNTVSGSLASGSTEVNASGSGGTITIDIQNSSAALDFGTTTANNFNGTTVISITNSGMGSVTFSNLSMPGGANGTGLLANSGGTINIGGTSSAITARLALDITNTSFGSGATFSSITSINSGGKGVNLDNVSGPVVINGGSITNSTGIAFDLNAGSGTITYAGTISNANRAVEVTGRNGGTVTFSGNITNTGTGINVASNTGGTIAFSGSSKSLNTGGNNAVTLATNPGATINFTGGGLVISTTSGIGFSATGGATALTVQGTGNTINSTSGTAINVTSTTIGASGLTFQSISANGSASGIILSNTGSTGGLTVTGMGTIAGSGGTIQNTTGNSLNLSSIQTVSLSNLNVSGSGAHGINGSSVNGLTLTGCQLTNSGNADNEYGMNLSNCTGTLSVNSTTFNNAADNLVYITSTSGTLTANFQNNSAFIYPTSVSGTANSAILIEPGNNAVINTTIQNCTFTNIRSASAQFGYNIAASSGTSNFNFSNNTITINLAGRAGGVVISGQENSATNITINNNNFSGAGGNGVINIDVNDNSRVTGTANGNVITNPPGIGMFVAVDENAKADVTLNANTITNSGGDGIQTVNFGGVGVSNMRLSITNNNINGHSNNTLVSFLGGISFTGFEDNSCIAVRGNSVTGTPVSPTQCGGAACVDYYIEEVSGVLTFEEVPNTANTTLTAAYLNSINDAGPVTIFGVIDLTNGATCPVP